MIWPPPKPLETVGVNYCLFVRHVAHSAERMDRTSPDPKQKRERFLELAQTGKVKTGKVFAADLRKSKVPLSQPLPLLLHRDLPTLQSGVKLSRPNRLAEVVIHPCRETLFAFSMQGVGRQSYDVDRRLPRAW
jgi:hypothetical protein